MSSEMLVGSDSNTNYALVSAIQVEEGPRLFYPHLGFYFKAANTRLKVILVETASGTKHEIKNNLLNAHDNELDIAVRARGEVSRTRLYEGDTGELIRQSECAEGL